MRCSHAFQRRVRNIPKPHGHLSQDDGQPRTRCTLQGTRLSKNKFPKELREIDEGPHKNAVSRELTRAGAGGLKVVMQSAVLKSHT